MQTTEQRLYTANRIVGLKIVNGELLVRFAYAPRYCVLGPISKELSGEIKQDCESAVRRMDPTTLEALDNAICLICKEMGGISTERVIALAKVLRDLAVARVILKDGR